MSVIRKPVQFTWTDRFRGFYRLVKTIPVFIQLYWKLLTNTIDIGYLLSYFMICIIYFFKF